MLAFSMNKSLLGSAARLLWGISTAGGLITSQMFLDRAKEKRTVELCVQPTSVGWIRRSSDSVEGLLLASSAVDVRCAALDETVLELSGPALRPDDVVASIMFDDLPSLAAYIMLDDVG